jgi:hypothetical protein
MAFGPAQGSLLENELSAVGHRIPDVGKRIRRGFGIIMCLGDDLL